MSQAIVDPHELRRFAHALDKFSNELQGQMLVLRKQLIGLGNTWRDQEHDKFVAEFEDTLRTTSRFFEAAREHVPFLLRKADRVEDYLKQR